MRDQSISTLAMPVALGLAMLNPNTAHARVTRIVIDSIAPDTSSPNAPRYEIVKGRFYGEVDPVARENAIITDLSLAPRNLKGKVEYWSTFALARPVEARHASGVLFYDVPNRGNGTVAADSFGHVRVISGWQADIDDSLGLQTLHAPIARKPNGDPLTGPILARFVDMPQGSNTTPIVGSIGRPTAMPEPLTLNTRAARLYVQSTPGGTLRKLLARDWAFADCTSLAFPGQPDPGKLCLRRGFDPALAYTLVYTAKGPKVMGLGFAATRDLVSFLRHARVDDNGTPNPAGKIRWAVASGTSQSGNYLKSFVNLGFNGDEQGQIVFDGINPNIAARQVPLNVRFGVPGGAARPFEPGSEGTLWWAPYHDVARGRGTSSLLDRCARNATCPKVIETFGSAEFWGLRMSPGLVGTKADTDIPLPETVRRYYFPSVTHGGSWTGGWPQGGDSVPVGCLLPGNPNPMIAEVRLLQQRLVEWVRDGKTPPLSVYPTIADSELVKPDARSLGWRHIPGAQSPDGKINRLFDQNFGDAFSYNDLSGVLTRQPPHIGREIPLLVPRVDEDGNETSGIRSVQLMVPLGTYLGWNVQASGFNKGKGCAFAGGFIPFRATKAERIATHDPRPSLEERYGTRDGFLERVKEAVKRHRNAGWLTDLDAQHIIYEAEKSSVMR